jgi:hypothetical protein
MGPFRRLTLNSILMLCIAAACIVGGVCLLVTRFYRITGVGLFFLGIGNTALGLTEGFVDQRPAMKPLIRGGVIAYLIGLPILAYGLFKLF